MFMPFTVTQDMMVHSMAQIQLSQLMIKQSLSSGDVNDHYSSGWSMSLLLIGTGVVLLIFAICQVVSSWL